MSAWTDDYLAELRKRGEIELSTDVPLIFHRFSISTIAGVPTYTLPDGILSISRITYEGHRVWPYDERTLQMQGIFKDPFTEERTGRPYVYMQHNYGFTQITFWPTPDVGINADDNGIWGGDIANRVIISCWMVADPTGETFRVPEFLRRRFNKYYVNMRAYTKEGPTQNIQAAMYFRDRYVTSKNQLREAVNSIPKAIVKYHVPMHYAQHKIARPVLPPQFGRIVE